MQTAFGMPFIVNSPKPPPTDTKELDAEGRESIEKLVEKLEEDDDVTNVYHNMKEVDEE